MPGGAGREDYSAMPVGGSGANYSSKNGNKSTKTHTGNGVQKVSTAAATAKFLKSGNPVSLAYQFGYNLLKAPFKKKTSQQKVELNIKKGLDPSNPAEMHAVKPPRVYHGPEGHQSGIKSLGTTAPSISAVSEPSTGHEWDFQAYSKGNLVKGTKQELSGGVRFGPPPLRGPDPQGLDVLLSNSNYFRDLLK